MQLRKVISKIIKESYDDLEIAIRNKLLSFGGDNIKFGLDSDEEQIRLLNDGKLFNGQIVFSKGFPNQCHRNVADRYRKTVEKGFKIITGYALSDGIWVQHSWGFYKGTIVETTPISFDSYYGYELTEEESEDFCFSNY
jgi:hypothetical protein